LAESNKQSKAGQEMRFINIPAKPYENSFGIFEDLHNFDDASEFAKYLQESSSKYYGVASVEFIKNLLEAPSIRELYKNDYKRMRLKLPNAASEQDKRVFERFMFVGFAGELAAKYDITGWAEGISYNAALKCFNS
jgi:putative DNA primase/helicase